MKAIVIAEDRRKASQTDKLMVLSKLAGTSLLARNLTMLKSLGVDEALVIAGGQSEAVRKHLEGSLPKGLGLSWVVIGDGVDPISFLKGGDSQGGEVLVLLGSTIYDKRIIDSLMKTDGTAYAYDSKSEIEEEIGVVVKGGIIRGVKPASEGGGGVLVGAFKLGSKAALPFLERLLQGSEVVSDGRRPTADTLYGKYSALNEIAGMVDVKGLDVAAMPSYLPDMRRSLKPYWLPVKNDSDLRRAKKVLVEASQKRTLDLLAWYFNRPIENFIVYHISDLPVTPNQLSVLTNVVAYVATFLFFKGYLLIPAIIAFVVNVLDGLDGKLARVRGTTSKLGQMEHSFDLLYEQSWYISFAWLTYSQVGALWPLGVGILMILFDSFSRHSSMQFKEITGVSLADYSPFDRAFRKFDGRRNTYSIYILIGAIIKVPYVSLAAMCAHSAITAAVYAYQAIRHLSSSEVAG